MGAASPPDGGVHTLNVKIALTIIWLAVAVQLVVVLFTHGLPLTLQVLLWLGTFAAFVNGGLVTFLVHLGRRRADRP